MEQPSFREKYDLSRADIDQLVPLLISEKIPEDTRLRKKYFAVSKELTRRSYKEIDLSDDPNAFITIDLPEKSTSIHTLFRSPPPVDWARHIG